MAKPILVIKAPVLTNEQERNFIQSLEHIRKGIQDYYVIGLPGCKDGYGVQVFFEKDMEEASFDELKEYVRTTLNR